MEKKIENKKKMNPVYEFFMSLRGQVIVNDPSLLA